MKYNHDSRKRPARVSEPVQVYLDAGDQDRLERLTGQLQSTKSDVLRRGLEALERQLLDPEQHPVLKIIGMGGTHRRRSAHDYDVARAHDRFLGETEADSWTQKKGKPRGR